jgi:hypothetical protein
MHNGRHVILHLVFDGILFDRVYSRFEQMQNYENTYLLGDTNPDNEIKYITNREKVIKVNSLDAWGKIVNDEKIDIIYMHGLWPDYLKAIDYIRDHVKVMWWCYGMEIYENCFGYAPLMQMKIYKPLTFNYILGKCSSFRSRMGTYIMYNHPKFSVSIRNIKDSLLGRPNKMKQMLSRIDYAFTPLPIELDELKKRHRYIKADPFRLSGTIIKMPITPHKNTGHVLLEHSANISNNHLDVIRAMKSIDVSSRIIHVPLNYGPDDMKELVKANAKFENADVDFIEDIMPLENYKSLISECSHAVFGMMRQSGLGNIYLCLRNGVKLFFFKDSMLYKHFKSQGYYVYSIEEDMTDEAIKTPLTTEENVHNYELYYKIFPERSIPYDQQFNKILGINE